MVAYVRNVEEIRRTILFNGHNDAKHVNWTTRGADFSFLENITSVVPSQWRI
jgi:hypothetical protein